MDGLNGQFKPRRLLTDTITEEITAWIASGKYKPGDALPAEGELAKHFNVSKPSVRESLKHLMAIGAIEISHGRPPTVCAMSAMPLVNFFHLAVTDAAGSLREAVELRKGLEIQSILLATQRATDADIAELASLIGQLEQHKNDLEHWVPLHVAFHLALVKASHNRFFTFLQVALQETIERTNRQLLAFNPARDPEQAFQSHKALFHAVCSKDVLQARAAIEAHFGAIDRVLYQIDHAPAPVAPTVKAARKKRGAASAE